MKAILLISALFAGSAFAQTVEEKSFERSRQVVPLEIELNKQTVRCLVGDYGGSSLKISLAGIRPYTVFPQTTRGETAPCINAGRCKTRFNNGLTVDQVIDNAKPMESINVTVVLFEELQIDHTNKTCHRSLREVLDSPVRGLNFHHEDGASIGTLPYDVCVTMY